MHVPKLIMLIGLQGSGKSTIAKELAIKYNADIISSDKMRKVMFGNESMQFNNDKLFNEIHNNIRNLLSQGKSVIYDATNINTKRRKGFIQTLHKIVCEKYAVVVATTYKKCVDQNNLRERVVAETVIYNTYKSFNMPAYFEGWDNIDIIYHTDTKFINTNDWVDSTIGYNQDNPHHSATLGMHCLLCRNKLLELGHNYKSNLCKASLIHDCGKPTTRTYKDSKGINTGEIAHYYNHNCTGAYESLFFDKELNIKDKIERALYIQYHMLPYVWEKDGNKKLMNNYRNLWGEYFFSNIVTLHIADLSAH